MPTPQSEGVNPPLPGFVHVGWRNLSDGTFQAVKLSPGYGWTPVYVQEIAIYVVGLTD